VTHLTDRAIEQLVERELPPEERKAAESHLDGCVRCQEAVAATRAFFAELEGLPAFDPSPLFAERVMGQLHIQPAAAPFWARLRAWIPSTRRGWAWVAAASAVPALLGSVLLVWWLTTPALSPASMARWGWVWLSETGSMAVSSAIAAIGGGIASVIIAFVEMGAVAPLATLTMFLLASLLVTPVSAWSLARLLRTPHEGAQHA